MIKRRKGYHWWASEAYFSAMLRWLQKAFRHNFPRNQSTSRNIFKRTAKMRTICVPQKKKLVTKRWNLNRQPNSFQRTHQYLGTRELWDGIFSTLRTAASRTFSLWEGIKTRRWQLLSHRLKICPTTPKVEKRNETQLRTKFFILQKLHANVVVALLRLETG